MWKQAVKSEHKRPDGRAYAKKCGDSGRFSPDGFLAASVISVFFLVFLFMFTSNATASAPPALDKKAAPAFLKKRVAVLPFENLSYDQRAMPFVTGALKKDLADKGWIDLVDDSEVAEFLAKRRIRYTGSVTRLTAREMGTVLGADAVLVGAVILFSESRSGGVMAGVTARLVSTIDGSIVWADSISYAGKDFEGLLGLGVIDSVEDLSGMVVNGLVEGLKDIPSGSLAGALSPFEIDRVTAYPPVGRSAERITLRVKVQPITETPEAVVAYIGGNEATLRRVEGDLYEGTVEAPPDEGVYPIDIESRNTAKRLFTFRAAGSIAIDNTPPEIDLALNRKVFAPVNKGYVTFSPHLRNFDSIDEWRIEILDNNGDLVRSDKGYGKLPRGIIWKGETDRMRIVQDGTYEYRFKVKDPAGNLTVLDGKLKVKQRPPDIKVDVDVMENILTFTFDRPEDEVIEGWKLSLFNKDGEDVKVIDGKGALPEKLELPMAEDLEVGKLAFAISATDEAGNTFALKKTISSIFATKRIPFSNLKPKGQILENF